MTYNDDEPASTVLELVTGKKLQKLLLLHY